MANSLVQLQKYFGVDAREFRLFWTSLTADEQEYYKTAELS